MDESTSVGKLLGTLRQQLKLKGLSYRTVASSLNVSEATIKRYFHGRGVNLDILERLAEVVDLDLLSLVILAKDQEFVPRNLTKAQHAFLRRRSFAGGVFLLLRTGWTPEQLVSEFDLDHGAMEASLTRLEGLGLIRRVHGRHVQILVRPDLGGRASGPMGELAVEVARQFLRSVDLQSGKCEWMFSPVRVSRASLDELRGLMKHFHHVLGALTKRDQSLSKNQTQWFRVCIVSQPANRNEFLPF